MEGRGGGGGGGGIRRVEGRQTSCEGEDEEEELRVLYAGKRAPRLTGKECRM